jgi:hypothetical protein
LAVEALARSGVGRLTMIDLDDVCVTNVNRQLPALDGQIGRSKVAVLTERVRDVLELGSFPRGLGRRLLRRVSGWNDFAGVGKHNRFAHAASFPRRHVDSGLPAVCGSR